MNTKTRATRKPEPQADLHPQTQMEPTPRPWRVESSPLSGSDGAYYITPLDTLTLPMFSPIARLDTNSSERDEANATLIVRAVNTHDDLLEALKTASDWMWAHAPNFSNRNEVRQRIDAAVAKAGGGNSVHAASKSDPASYKQKKEVASDREP